MCIRDSINTVPKSDLLDNTGRKVMELEESDFSQLFAAGYQFPEPFKVKAADGDVYKRQVLNEIQFEIGHYSLFNSPAWFTDGVELQMCIRDSDHTGSIIPWKRLLI